MSISIWFGTKLEFSIQRLEAADLGLNFRLLDHFNFPGRFGHHPVWL